MQFFRSAAIIVSTAILIVAVSPLVLLMIFGPKRLPEMGRSLGTAIREFKSALAGSVDDNSHSTKPASETA